MSHGQSDQHAIEHTHNTARFFTEWRHISWVLLIATIVWGVYGYLRMPQRKDPDVPIRQALAMARWPGARAEKIEQLVTRRLEEKIAENTRVDKIESNTRTGSTAVPSSRTGATTSFSARARVAMNSIRTTATTLPPVRSRS